MNCCKTIWLTLCLLFSLHGFCICPDYLGGMVWKGYTNSISLSELAHYAAPMFWFSPDEKLLMDENGHIQLPQSFPFEDTKGPVAYYKIRHIFSYDTDPFIEHSENSASGFKHIDLDVVSGLDLDYYYYFEKKRESVAIYMI